MEKKWTKEELVDHLNRNKNNVYSMAIPLAALYKRIYGELPKIGLSGYQAEAVECVLKNLP